MHGADVGVFGGSGFYAFLDDVETVELATPFGPPSAPVTIGTVEGRRVAFLPRHGRRHELAPHAIPYRANVWAMRELGVRVALGARRGAVVWMVLREACVLTALGLTISVPVVLGTSHLVESFLFDMKPNDPAALISAVAVLVIAGLTAGYVPAWRASRISPMLAIRQD